MHHLLMQVVLNIAFGAAAEFRPASLAIAYDELFRKDIENKAGQLGASWAFADLFTQVDDNVLRMARRHACVECASLVILRLSSFAGKCRKWGLQKSKQLLPLPSRSGSAASGKTSAVESSTPVCRAVLVVVCLDLLSHLLGGALWEAQPRTPTKWSDKRGKLHIAGSCHSCMFESCLLQAVSLRRRARRRELRLTRSASSAKVLGTSSMSARGWQLKPRRVRD